MVDLDSLTSSGRSNAEKPPNETTPLDELTVAQLGSAYVDGYNLECPSDVEGCAYRFQTDLQQYNLDMLAVYPECETCGCVLVVSPPGDA